MRKFQIIISVIASITGIGSSLVLRAKEPSEKTTIHNWVTAGGTAVPELNQASTDTVADVCGPGRQICLRSTDGNIIILGTFVNPGN